MANTVNKGGISAKVHLGNLLDVDIKIGGTAKVTDKQGKGIFQNVNDNFTKNPNHRPVEHAGDGDENWQNQGTARDKGRPKGNQDDHTAPPANRRNNNGEPEIGEDGNLKGRPARGENGDLIPVKNGDIHASENGLEHGRGHQKGANQQQIPTQETPPIVILPTDEKGDQRTGRTQNTPPIIIPVENQGNPKNGGTQNTPPIVIMPETTTQNTPPIVIMPETNMPDNHPHTMPNLPAATILKTYGNQTINLIRTVVNEVLRQNDVYLSRNTINRIINNQISQNSTGPNNQTYQTSPRVNNQTVQNSTRTNNQTFQNAGWKNTTTNLPREVSNLVQNIGSRVLSMLDNSQHQGKMIHEISKEISHQIQENIQTAKSTIIKNADLNAVQFKNLNISEKMQVAVELLPVHVPPKAIENLQNFKAQEILNGLLLARGLIVPNEQQADVRNLVAFKAAVLPPEVSMTTLRDVGQLVKVLIADTAMLKTTANLDLAVQKFVKILLANNELGVLLATVNLASQTQSQGGLISRSLALAQIYRLIDQLIQAGEKAMKEAAPENASKNILLKERNVFQSAGLSVIDEADEQNTLVGKLHTNDAAGSLRQFLEFNPAFVFDNSASAFNNPDDARQAQKDFINIYHDDIEQWLRSGNHRLVKDFDFDRPVGVVVERNNSNIFTANTARFVLVRDGSVQGWHFLKSFLVK